MGREVGRWGVGITSLDLGNSFPKEVMSAQPFIVNCVEEADDKYSPPLASHIPCKMEHCWVVCGLNADALGSLGS